MTADYFRRKIKTMMRRPINRVLKDIMELGGTTIVMLQLEW